MPDDIDLLAAREQATAWVRNAADVARRRFGCPLTVSVKPDRSLLTDVDVEVQSRLTADINRAYSGHAVLGEEDSARDRPSPSRQRYTWVIDPVDGTRNYAHGFPCYCIALALIDGPRPVLGVIHDPVSGYLFDAVEGHGVRLGGEPLRPPTLPAHHDLLIGFPGASNLRIPAALFEVLGPRTNLRNMGSTCLHLALVASGAMDGAYGRKAKLWDLAAGAVLISESGACCTAQDGGPIFPLDPAGYRGEDLPFVAARRELHGDMLRAVSLGMSRM
jgi:myo-inositol-1(or 4)-monophosphatase